MDDINFILELEQLNPNVQLRRYEEGFSNILFSSVPANQLLLPYGSICKDKNHIFYRKSREETFRSFVLLPFREAVVKSFLPMERWIHDTSFTGLKEIFQVYSLKKDDDDYLALEREYQTVCKDKNILLKLKFVHSWVKSVSSTLQCDKFDDEVFGEVASITYQALQDAFFKQFSLDIVEPTLILQDIQVTGYILSLEIVEALFSKDHYFDATLKWFSYLYSFEKEKITEL